MPLRLLSSGHGPIASSAQAISGRPIASRRVVKCPLSARQGRCLYLSAHGFTDDEIADTLHIAVATVRFHFLQAQTKLAARNRRHAIYLATIAGLFAEQASPVSDPRPATLT